MQYIACRSHSSGLFAIDKMFTVSIDRGFFSNTDGVKMREPRLHIYKLRDKLTFLQSLVLFISDKRFIRSFISACEVILFIFAPTEQEMAGNGRQREKERIKGKWDEDRNRELKGNETKREKENKREMRQREKERIKRGKWDKGIHYTERENIKEPEIRRPRSEKTGKSPAIIWPRISTSFRRWNPRTTASVA